MVKLPKYCWILLKYCKKIDLQPCTNPTRVHRSWLRVHDFTRWMERCFTARELVITRSRLQWNAALLHDRRPASDDQTTKLSSTENYGRRYLTSTKACDASGPGSLFWRKSRTLPNSTSTLHWPSVTSIAKTRSIGSVQSFLANVNSRSRSLYAIARPSVCLSVCRLSVVCNARAPYSGGWNFRQYFYGIRYPGHPLTSTENFTEIVPGEPLRRGS